jgi:hypothetical protein
MMPGALDDQAWADICAAAAKHVPDAEARAEMSACLFVEYSAMAAVVSDRAHVKDMHDRAQKIGKQAATLAASIRQQMAARRRVPAEDDDPLWRDLRHALVVFQSARNQVLGYRAILRANARRKNAQREWLISRLCGIWLDHFHAPKLAYSRKRGGPPSGPLIRFMLAAMRQIMPRLPSPETIADAIDRERADRKRAKQMRKKLEQRARMGD